MSTELQKIAKALWQRTRRDVWGGGYWEGSSRTNFPHALALPPSWQTWLAGSPWGRARKLTFSVSPEVTLKGMRMRLLVGWSETWTKHDVIVYVDDEIKHPGGAYEATNRWWHWSWKIARDEWAEGGKTGYVDVTDLVLAEAAGKPQEPKPNPAVPAYCDHCYMALTEAEVQANKARQGSTSTDEP